MTTNSICLKDECVFVQNTVLFLNPPYYSGDIKKKVIAIISKYQKDTWDGRSLINTLQNTIANWMITNKMEVWQ